MTTAEHYCPGCGAARKAFPRYPWHFCNDCRDLATDGQGRPLVFANASLSGGLVFGYANEEARYDCGSVRCYINERPVLVREARFGGVVAEPLTSGPIGVEPYNFVDLRHGLPDDMKPVSRPRSGGSVGRGKA